MERFGDDTPPPGGRGAGRWGIKTLPFEMGERGAPPRVGVLRGMGGGARGFSKLSMVLLGKRGLCGGLIMGVIMALMCGLRGPEPEKPDEED
jgi:hypothetical protein